jgi:hypothetical protein
MHSPSTGSAASVATRRHAAVDDDLGAGDEARLVGSEEQRRIGGIAAVAGFLDTKAKLEAIGPR